MSKIFLEGYVINVEDRTIDFSAVPNFDPSRLDYIIDPIQQQTYFALPRPQINWGTWNGPVFTLSPNSAMPRLRPTTKLHCPYTPPLVAG